MSEKSFEVVLPSGTVAKVTIALGKEVITRKLKYWTGTCWRSPSPPQSVYVKVPGVRLLVEVSGVLFSVRSCCKPPDHFCARAGRLKAARRLLAVASLKALVQESDRKALLVGIVRGRTVPVRKTKTSPPAP